MSGRENVVFVARNGKLIHLPTCDGKISSYYDSWEAPKKEIAISRLAFTDPVKTLSKAEILSFQSNRLFGEMFHQQERQISRRDSLPSRLLSLISNRTSLE
jgi:hypothetical protein